MSRLTELAAAATRVQYRGSIIDFFGQGPTFAKRYGRGYGAIYGDERMALCVCKHGKEWPEGDAYEDNGGAACAECCREAHAERVS